MKSRIVAGVGVLTVALGLAACGSTASSGAGSGGSAAQASQGVTKSSILVGTTMPLTGGAAASGAAFKAGLQAAVDQVNASGGINGRKIKLDILDDGFVPARSVANVLRLVEQDKVFAIDTPVGSAELPGSWPTVQRTGVVMFGPYLPPDPNLPSVFELATPHTQQAEVISDWLASKNLTKVAYIGQNNAYGDAVLQGVKNSLSRDHLTLVATAQTQTNSTNVSSAVLTVKNANPQAVVLGTDNTQAALVLKQAQQLGWQPLFVGDASAANTGTTVTTAAAGSAANGLYGALVGALPTASDPQVAKYRAAMKKYAPSEVNSTYALQAYGQNLVFFHILKLMGNDLTWKNFEKVAQTVKGYVTGLLPPVSFGPLPGGHTGTQGAGIAKYDNGTWTSVLGFTKPKAG